jgi:putative ubiquitin-RnfH superfamily antitoxin RatB of RatAB toxin-antitoxin module
MRSAVVPTKSIRIEVVCALPGAADAVTLSLPAGSTAAEAVAASGLQGCGKIGIFGKVVDPQTPLSDGDRVEIYRPLALDPKEARRRRARRKP